MAVHSGQTAIVDVTIALNCCVLGQMLAYELLQGLCFDILYHLHMGKQQNAFICFERATTTLSLSTQTSGAKFLEPPITLHDP